MADVLALEGPLQRGRGFQGKYVYWICMPFPKPETVAQTGVQTPADYDRTSFRVLVVEAHAFCGVEVLETACFLEPHANGDPHFNLLVRAKKQYRWKNVAERLLNHHRIHVGFGCNIKTWAEGVAYGRVASDHKPEEGLDASPEQWHANGAPTPFEQVIPHRWQQPGFVRHTRLTPLIAFDLCVEHGITSDTDLWAKAQQLSDTGDRALLAFCLENDPSALVAKVLAATAAKEKQRRARLTREALLEEFVAKNTCCCPSAGHCFDLMKEILVNNGLDGHFQKEVMGALRAGRAKKRNVCLIGPPDCGKSFLLKGMLQLFHTYTRPEGGSYQLENLLGKELVFLNDFEYDASAKEWMPWQYFKKILEGEHVQVGCPKNRGGNQLFTGSAPVFLTAPQEVTLVRYGKQVAYETEQMRKRIVYFTLCHTIPEESRKEVLRVCPHCSARVYLEGKALLDCPIASHSPSLDTVLGGEGRPAKRQRSRSECFKDLRELKSLLDDGVVTQNEFEKLKANLIAGN
jgi:hypothetical protein